MTTPIHSIGLTHKMARAFSHSHRPQVFKNLDESLNKHRLYVSPSLILLFLYLPVGLILFIMRLCMLLQALLILFIIPKGTFQRYMLRVLFGVMGLVVIHKDFKRNRSLSARMLVCNKISNIDHIFIHLTMTCTTTSLVGNKPIFSHLFYHHHFDTNEQDKIENQLKQLPEFDDSVSIPDTAAIPYIAQPEIIHTNGNKLFNFNVWPFTVESIVQPISLSSWRPFNVPLSVVDSTGLVDMLWSMFLPFTIVTVQILPTVDSDGTKTSDEFSKKVQNKMSTWMDIPCVNVTSEDIKNWKEESITKIVPNGKKIGPIISESEYSSVIPPTAEFEQMVHQVIGVLPHVPVNVARQDLNKTRSVDVTITNFLEGKVRYDPVQYKSSSSISSGPRSSLSRSAKPSIEESHRKFQERKKTLLDDARRRYVEKHGPP